MDFRGFYDEHVALVWRALFRLGVPRADLPDAVQEVFLVAYRKLPEFEGRSKLSTWLIGICFRVASDRRRLAHVRREVGDTEALLGCGDERPGADQLIEQQERAQVLDGILALLRPEQREVFVMFELEELSGKEIAAIVGAPLKTVFSRLRLARAAFTTALETRHSGSSHGVGGIMPVVVAEVGKRSTP
jgi:RNA polymerase sigma-70 factor (ECF subfamily)